MELENKDIDDILSNIAQSSDTILNTTSTNSNITAYKQDYIAMLKDIPLNISVILGTVSVPLKRVLELKQRSILELDRNSDDDVDIYINDRLIAKGQIVALDNEYGVRITSMLARSLQDGSLEEIPQDH